MTSLNTRNLRKAAPVANRPPARVRHSRHCHGSARPNTGYRRPGLAREAPGCRVMEWSRLYASLPDHTRVQAAEDNGDAGWLLAMSLCYCTSAESGGFIPDTQVPRFGCRKLRQKVDALVREGLWLRDDERRGYVLDPEIWTEERNLSDAAERKKEADRKRIADKRAAARAAANGSPDV